MTFINEYISPEDLLEYNIEGINSATRSHSPKAPAGIPTYVQPRRDWTIDRERDIYLRQVTTNQGRPDMGFENDGWEGWTLYWKGELVWFALKRPSSGGKPDEPQWISYLIKSMTIPEQLQTEKNAICSAIEESLLAYRGGGVYDTSTEFAATFTFAD